MRVTDLTRSTPFRLAVTLTASFLVAYAVAAIFTLRALRVDLDERVVEEVEMTSTGLAGLYRAGGRQALFQAIEVREATVDAEDEVIWLGTSAGLRLMGAPLATPMSLGPRDVAGGVLAADVDDRYRIAVRDLDDVRLIVALSYEDSDEIGEAVRTAFGWATVFVMFLAVTVAALLTQRGQLRIDVIASTLQSVSRGHMNVRVPVSGSGDDLDRVSVGINDALGQLESTVDGIRQVSTNIAHDLRTPINRLGIQLERMRNEVEGGTKLEEQLEEIAAEIQGISKTFDSLLRIAQIEAGARKTQFAAISLPEIAIALHEAYLLVAEEYGQELVLNLPPMHHAKVYGDRNLLTQLFANLVENAIRHCPRGTTIRMEVSADPKCVWMTVGDDGPGIPTEEQEQVLKRFYRLDKSRRTAGSGLGLAIVKAICDLHGATLSLGDNLPGLAVRLDFPYFDDGPLEHREGINMRAKRGR